jgi:hypothetical protein
MIHKFFQHQNKRHKSHKRKYAKGRRCKAEAGTKPGSGHNKKGVGVELFHVVSKIAQHKKAHDQFLDRELGKGEELRIAKTCRQLLPTAALLPCPLLSVSLRTKLFALQTNCHVRSEIHP